MPIDRIEDKYHRNRALGYVFTDRIHLPYVMLAAENRMEYVQGSVRPGRADQSSCRGAGRDLHFIWIEKDFTMTLYITPNI